MSGNYTALVLDMFGEMQQDEDLKNDIYDSEHGSGRPSVNTLKPEFTRDELARKGFVSSLRNHVMVSQAQNMREHYHEEIAPKFERIHGRLPEDGMEVHKEMKKDRHFRFYSSIRTCAQEMVHSAVIPAVDREMDCLADRAKQINSDASDVGGSLALNPDFEVPSSVSELDVHLLPGSFHSEYRQDDVSVGAIYDNATRVFAFEHFGKEMNDIGMTMSNFVRLKHSDLKPQKILDCGCTIGHNTLPWAQTFPEAEVHAIDVSAGLLRYGHARAQEMGVPVHFAQMNANSLDFEDNSFDVVFSSMFLHELPLKDIKAYFSEAFRVLKPGGIFLTMELPPKSSMPAYDNFYLNWDSYYNNEPYFKPFRDQDYADLCVGAGFAKEEFFEVTLPRYTFISEDEFKASINGETVLGSTGRMDPKKTRWYGFGAIKR